MQFLYSLPKVIIVGILLVGGVLVFVLLDPPHTICDSQVSIFQQRQKTFLFEGEKKVLNKPTKTDYEILFNICITRNSSGGCAELFFRLKEMLRDFSQATEQCSQEVAEIPQVKNAIWKNIESLVRGAWGTEAPSGAYEKFGWLTPSDLNLYCQLKNLAQTNYPQQEWVSLREKLMAEFTKKHTLSRTKVWPLVLFSTQCEAYL